MDRKTFIKTTIGALTIAIPAYALISCSGSDDSGSNDPTGGDPNCLENGARASSITSNHGHSLTVSREDVEAGLEKTYSIEGSAGHVHNVTVTAANFGSLQNNGSVNLDSTSGNGHSHSVTITCA